MHCHINFLLILFSRCIKGKATLNGDERCRSSYLSVMFLMSSERSGLLSRKPAERFSFLP
jgi:hypothetical protein